MNKHRHQLRYNKTRGLLMAVAETVRGTGGQRRARGATPALDPECFVLSPGAVAVLLFIAGSVGLSPYAEAQIVGDPNALQNLRPSVISAANGVPLVNIQTPSGAGVSRNAYSQFDVQSNGAILNNARSNAQTQLGGWVQANPNLAAGSARVILNEINSANPSQLRGYVEVAGDRAQVVIANPAGVTCDGCGFINASRATLTTGTPIVNGGNLDGYRVEGGQIVVQGTGLDASQADYTDLIARSVQINAGLWANQLKITTGANQVSADNATATPIAGSGAAPSYGIDVAQLGGMYAGKIVLIGTEAGVGMRNAGAIGATAGEVTVTVDGQLTNRGRITAVGGVGVNAGGLDNAGGQVQATGDIALTLGNGSLDNTAGLLRSNQTLSISADRIVNSTTQGTDQGLEGHAVTLTAHQIANDDGAIRADLGLAITSAGSLDNTRGLIAGGTIDLLDPNRAVPGNKTLAITNTSGTLFASQNLTIDAASLGGDGHLYARNDLDLRLTGNFTHSGQLIADHDLTFLSTGQVGNSGLISAGNTLSLTATDLDNAAAGEVSGLTSRIVLTNSLTNRGLIDGFETAIDALTVNNLGTGRIYGDHLGIAATTLNNTVEAGVAPTIAARDRLDLGLTTLNNDNGAQLFASGDLAIGGTLDANRQASGRAGTLTNNGGTIQALGALAIATDSLINSNANFSATTVAGATVGSTTYYTSLGNFTADQIATYYDAGPWGPLLSGNGTPNPAGNGTISFDLNPGVANPATGGTGGSTGTLTVYSFIYETHQTLSAQVLSSAPGQILSGGNMALDASTTLTNDKSRIVAGGTLGILGQNINNIAAQVGGTESRSGISYNWGYGGHDGRSTGHGCDCDFYIFRGAAYAANVAVTLDVPITATSSLASVATRSTTSTPGSPSLPTSSLYTVNPAVNGHPLVETDPRFANYRTWLSSDYMQQQLALDPSVSQKRLGDGFYEQQLVRDQLAQLTGRRFLDGFASEETQYQALMNAGITQARAFDLHLGIALSAAQVAQLTSDIVWLVEQTVSLPDGSTQKVLVPQLYLMPRAGDLTADGTLIAGLTVHIAATGDVTNSGTVAGRDLLDLSAANLTNLGRLSANTVGLNATNDIANLGGRIEAVDSLALSAGRDLTVATTTASGDGAAGFGQFSRTQVDRVAGLYVTGSAGTLSAVAGRDLTLNAAEVVNAGTGTTTLVAGNDLNLGTVTTRDAVDITRDARNHARMTASSEVGTRITTAGELNLGAGNDLNGRAADLQAQGDLNVAAGNDVVFAAGRNTLSVDVASYVRGKKGGGLMGGTKTTASFNQQVDQGLARTTTLTGRNVTVEAGRDLAFEAGKTTAQDKLSLNAGRDLLVAASGDTRQESLSVASLRGAKQKQHGEQTISDTAQGGVLVAGGDLSLNSGRDTTLTGSALAAGQTASLSTAGNLALQAAESTEQRQINDYRSTKKRAETLSFEQGQVRQLLGTISVGSDLSVKVGGDFTADLPETAADGTVKADLMTVDGVVRGDSRQQVSVTRTGVDAEAAPTTSKVLGGLAAQGIRNGAADSFTDHTTSTGTAALQQYLQSGLLRIKDDPQLAGAIERTLSQDGGATLTYQDDQGRVSLTVAGQAKVQAVYNTLKLSETFDTKKFADQQTAQIVTLVAAVILTIYTGGAAAGTLGAAMAGAGTTAATVINAAIIGMSSTMIGQLAGGASFDKAFQAGLKSGATSALMAGIAVGVSSVVNGGSAAGTATTTTPVDSGSQTVQLGNTSTASTASTASNVSKLDTLMTANYWEQTGLNALAKGALTQAQGGKFSDGVLGSVVGSLGAMGAGIIGEQVNNTLANIVSHAVLGCAVAAAGKQDCASGAIGGAASATLARVVDSALPDKEVVTQDGTVLRDGMSAPAHDAIIAAGSVLGSMAIAQAAGKDVLTAGNAAANEVTNNYLTHRQIQDKKSALANATSDEQRAQIEQNYAEIDKQQQAAAADCLLKGQCTTVMMDADMLKGVLADLNASCAPPRICSADAVNSISQLNGLLTKAEAATPVYPLESAAALLATGGLGTSAGSVPGVSNGMRLIGGVIGGTANYAFQDHSQNTDYIDVTLATITGALTVGRTLLPTTLINTGGSLIGSTIKGEDPYPGMAAATLGTITGYRVGKSIEIPLNNKMNPWYRSDWIKGPLGTSTWNAPSVVPSVSGNVMSSIWQENIGNTTKNAITSPEKH